MNRFNFFFEQEVTEAELDEAFDFVDQAFKDFVAAFDYTGITNGGEVTEHAPPNLTVLVNGPSVIYDQNQQRIAWVPTQTVDMTLDENGAATAVAGGGNEKYLSIFAQYKTIESDPRVDGNDDELFFRITESFQLNVVQGAEATAGSAVPAPLRGDQILLADVLIAYGDTTILNAAINFDRTQLAYVLEGDPLEIRERTLRAVLQSMLDTINGFNGSTIAVDPIADAPLSTSATTVQTVLAELLGFINDETALLDRSNTFTVGPQIVDDADASHPLLKTTKKPADDANAANIYKILWEFPTTAALGNARAYVGSSTIRKQLVFCINAKWDPATQTWSSDVTSRHSIRLSLAAFTATSVAIQTHGPDAGTWTETDWGTDSYGSTVGNLVIAGDVLYSPTRTRTRIAPLASAYADDWGYSVGANPLWLANPSSGILVVPLDLPNGALLTRVRATVDPASAHSIEMRIWRIDHNLAGGTSPTRNVGTSDDGDATGNQQVLTCNIGTSAKSSLNEFVAVFTPSGGGGDAVYSVDYDFTDAGLRND